MSPWTSIASWSMSISALARYSCRWLDSACCRTISACWAADGLPMVIRRSNGSPRDGGAGGSTGCAPAGMSNLWSGGRCMAAETTLPSWSLRPRMKSPAPSNGDGWAGPPNGLRGDSGEGGAWGDGDGRGDGGVGVLTLRSTLWPGSVPVLYWTRVGDGTPMLVAGLGSAGGLWPTVAACCRMRCSLSCCCFCCFCACIS